MDGGHSRRTTTSLRRGADAEAETEMKSLIGLSRSGKSIMTTDTNLKREEELAEIEISRHAKNLVAMQSSLLPRRRETEKERIEENPETERSSSRKTP